MIILLKCIQDDHADDDEEDGKIRFKGKRRVRAWKIPREKDKVFLSSVFLLDEDLSFVRLLVFISCTARTLSLHNHG